MEIEVLVLADYQLHSANNVIGSGIAHSCIPVVPIETLEVSVGPGVEYCVVLDRLKERAKDQSRVPLLLGRQAIERVKRIRGNSLRKSESRLIAIALEEVELHDAWKRLLLIVCAALAAIFSLRHIVLHDMGVDSTSLSFPSSISRASLIDEKEAWLLICVSESSHVVPCEADRKRCFGLRMNRLSDKTLGIIL